MPLTRAVSACALLLTVAACGSSGHKAASSVPSSTMPSSTMPSSTTFVSPLKPGPYGFLVPRTWNSEPTATGAKLTNPAGPGTIDYRLVPGTPSLHDAAGCAVTSSRATRADRMAFTCAPLADGEHVDGVVITTPSGSKVLTITLPASKRDVAMSIVASFRI
jgi:hypothetical protein